MELAFVPGTGMRSWRWTSPGRPQEAVGAALPPMPRTFTGSFSPGETEGRRWSRRLLEALADRFYALEVRTRTGGGRHLGPGGGGFPPGTVFAGAAAGWMRPGATRQELVTRRCALAWRRWITGTWDSQRCHARDFDRLSHANRGKWRDSG